MRLNTLVMLLMVVIAHRGGALLENENTIPAFSKAIEMGVDMIELDVHQTADGALVVCHDPTLDRTTDTNGKIEEMTLEEVAAARIKDFRTGEILDYGIPTLEDVFRLLDGRCGMLLEIKRDHKDQYPGIEENVLKVIERFGMHDKVTIQSFDTEVVKTVHQLDPTMRVEKLIFVGSPTFNFKKFDYCAAINPMGKLTSKAFIKKAHENGKEVKIWTINDPKDAIEGADGIITNRPDLFVNK